MFLADYKIASQLLQQFTCQLKKQFPIATAIAAVASDLQQQAVGAMTAMRIAAAPTDRSATIAAALAANRTRNCCCRKSSPTQGIAGADANRSGQRRIFGRRLHKTLHAIGGNEFIAANCMRGPNCGALPAIGNMPPPAISGGRTAIGQQSAGNLAVAIGARRPVNWRAG
ncbi:hypothetical protein [Derxia lacustris]|uniref:hypothetical protein n=1 Tax=Derxia lacustris TaxID=764842 RepID=UPI00111BFCEE|nr:hypothetical protein [Derxia lacustris]